MSTGGSLGLVAVVGGRLSVVCEVALARKLLMRCKLRFCGSAVPAREGFGDQAVVAIPQLFEDLGDTERAERDTELWARIEEARVN